MEKLFDHIIKLSPEELYKKALQFKEVNDYDNCIIYMTMSANYEYQLAQDQLRDDHFYNKFTRKINYSNVKSFFEATQEYRYSLNHLATLYCNGTTVEQDYNKAKELYEVAIKKGHPTSMYNLGLLYYYGRGVTKDYNKAKELFEIAISKDNADAMNVLGNMYYYGQNVVSDYDKAKELYEKAITRGNTDAMSRLGTMYKYGRGVEQDRKKAEELYELAVSKGSSHAMINLGNMYKGGGPMVQNYYKARELFELAITEDTLEISHINALTSLYVTTNLKNDKQYAIDYFLKINHQDKLKEIYAYDDYDIQMIIDNKKRAVEIAQLIKENSELRVHIMASPNGELYHEAKESWDKCLPAKS